MKINVNLKRVAFSDIHIKKPSHRAKLSIATGIIGALIISAIALEVSSNRNGNEGEEPSVPDSQCVGFYGNDDLESFRDWDALGRDGNSWSGAYLIEDLEYESNFVISYTSKFVVFQNITFEEKMTAFCSKNVKFMNCTFTGMIHIQFSEDIIIQNSEIAGGSIKIQNSDEIDLIQNHISNCAIEIINTDDCEIAHNIMAGTISLFLNYHTDDNLIYMNDVSGCTSLSVIDEGDNNLFIYLDMGNIVSFETIREQYPGCSFEDFTLPDPTLVSLMESMGIPTENLYVFSYPIMIGSGFIIHNPVCYIPAIIPEVTIELINPVAEPNIYAGEMPEIQITITDEFFIATQAINIKNSTFEDEFTAEVYGNLISGEYEIEITCNSIFGDVISDSVSCIKDIDSPIITSIAPNTGDFGTILPIISLEINDLTDISCINISTNGGEEQSIPFTKEGSSLYEINLNPVWASLDDGAVNFAVIVYDSVLLSDEEGLNFVKDTTSPLLDVEMGDIPIAGTNTPSIRFNVSVVDSRDVVVTLTINGDSLGAIDYTQENDLIALYSAWIHGDNEIEFIAVDALNNQNSTTITMDFDLLFEELNVELAELDALYYAGVFNFIAQFADDNFEGATYSIDGESRTLILGNNRMDEELFASLEEGDHTVECEAHDVFGNSLTAEFSWIKDTIAPELEILAPGEYEIYRKNDTAPILTINCSDTNLDRVYYIIENSAQKTEFFFNLSQSVNGTINATIDADVWNSLLDQRYVNITVIAVDKAGNLQIQNIIIITDPTYYIYEDQTYLWIALGLIAAVSITIGYKKHKSKKTSKSTELDSLLKGFNRRRL